MDNKKSNEERLKKIVSKQLSIKKDKIDHSTLLMDSSPTRPYGPLLDLFNKIQKEFDIDFPINDITSKLRTFGQVLNYINIHQERF